MKKGSILFLKLILLLIAGAALAAMIRFPQTEGRATNLGLVSIYTDPFIIYGYIASIPFFWALYQGFKLLGYAEKNKLFSRASVKALQNIKYCALALIGFIIGGEIWILLTNMLTNSGEDAAGAMAMGILATIISIIVAIVASHLGKRFGRAK